MCNRTITAQIKIRCMWILLYDTYGQILSHCHTAKQNRYTYYKSNSLFITYTFFTFKFSAYWKLNPFNASEYPDENMMLDIFLESKINSSFIFLKSCQSKNLNIKTVFQTKRVYLKFHVSSTRRGILNAPKLCNERNI